jgi:hypothetical protein
MDGRTKRRLVYGWMLLAVVASPLLAMTASQYQFVLAAELSQQEYVDRADELAPGIAERVEYGDLGPEKRALVDRAIEGERFYFGSYERVPRMRTPDDGDLLVVKDDTYYLFRRGRTFAWRTLPGAATIGLLLSVVLGTAQAYRWQR